MTKLLKGITNANGKEIYQFLKIDCIIITIKLVKNNNFEKY